MRIFIASFLLASLMMAGILYGLFAVLGQDLPSPERRADIEPSVATRILDRNGELVAELFVEDRVPLRISQVPRSFTSAMIAIEDRRFYQHWGIDVVGVLRAAKADLLRGTTTQGASTITQQLARNLFLHHRRTWKRKVREAILALRIERAFGKDEIFEHYMNQIYFGEGAYGVEAAARRFFGISAPELTLEQSAVLAGLPGNPAAFSPRRHPENCLRRRNHVLRAMWKTGAIDEDTYLLAREAPLVLKDATPVGRQGAYFTEMVRQQLSRRHGASEIYHSGLSVETTLDLGLQALAEEILEDHLQSLEKRNNYPYLRGNVDSMLTTPGLPSAEALPAPLRLQAALLAIDPASGAVRAMVGGRDFAESRYNRATQAPRQPASAFKPFIYTEAIRQGYRTCDILLDTPVEFENPGAPEGEESTWSPQNFKHTYHGPVTLRYALMKSINVPTARLLHAITPTSVVQLAYQMGVTRRLPRVLSLATGSGEMTLLEMTGAYAVLANHGIRVAPYLIDRVFDRNGQPLEVHNIASEQVLDERTAYIVVDMMRSVMRTGTGQTARTRWGFRTPSAGKTGTNDDYADAWFVGFTPDLVVGVWVGFDFRIPIGDKHTGTGAMAALPIWARFMKAAVERYGSREFEMPEGLVTVKTCLDSGFLPTASCPNVIDDVFLPGTEPRERCRLHRGGAEPGDDFRDLDHQLLQREDWLTPTAHD